VDRNDDYECGCPHSYDSDEQDECEDEDDSNRDSDDGENCGEAFGIMVEASWQTLLDRIKHGESLAGYIDKYSTYLGCESDTEESSNFDRDILEISEDKGSDN